MWLAWVGKPFLGLRCGDFGEGDGRVPAMEADYILGLL